MCRSQPYGAGTTSITDPLENAAAPDITEKHINIYKR